MPAVASVTLDHVTKRYGPVVAVQDLSLGIPDGELLMIVGPSGCGKTTALRLIAGLETPDRGAVLFDGRDVFDVAPAERDIAMVFEGYALYPHLAVRDNLAFSLRLHKVPDKTVTKRVADVAVAMGLSHLLRRRPPHLATGEAQHVAIGRAIVRDAPAVLLLDDALSHLDAQQRLEARAEVGRLHRGLGCTVVAVTHDQAEALAVGTRVAVMNDGALAQVGTPQELFEHPASAFVGGFIGSPPMNLMELELAREDGRPVARGDGLRVALQGPLAGVSPVAVGATVTLGIRPADLRIGPPETDGEVGFRGRCELVEYLGPRLIVHLRVGSVELLALDDPADDVEIGDIVDCAARVDRIHVFDPATGRASGIDSRVASAAAAVPGG
jgi:multiple sugar transport system ATP-binding protein